MARAGRPISKTGAAAAKKRAASKKSYRSKSTAERQALVQNRDKSAQRAADARRYAKQKDKRDGYHREQAKAKKGAVKPQTCQWPGCQNKSSVQFHHQGKDRWLCPTHHAMARKQK